MLISVNVLFSATPHLLAVFQPVMWITQKNDYFDITGQQLPLVIGSFADYALEELSQGMSLD